MIDLSIVIPIHNAESTIELCMDSILQQDFCGLTCEIICIVDSSTDKTLDIVGNYLKKYPNIVKILQSSEKDAGLSRNIGIKKSIGEYLTFIDSDDTVQQDYFRTIKKLMSKGKYDIFTFSYYYKTAKKLFKSKSSYLMPRGQKKSRLVSFFMNTDIIVKGFSWIHLYKSTFLKMNEILFPPTKLCFEDMPFNLICLKYTNKVYFLRKRIYIHSIDYNKSITNNLSKKLIFIKSINGIAYYKFYCLYKKFPINYSYLFLKLKIQNSFKKYDKTRETLLHYLKVLKNTNDYENYPWEGVVVYLKNKII